MNKHEYYKDNGYVVFIDLIPHKKIDEILQSYKSSILSSNSRFFRQNTNVYSKNNFNSYGHVRESFLDIHNYNKFPEFKESALDIYFCEQIQAALTETTGFEGHNLMQSMLFDLNTETVAHQDWWYLDSVPAGNLLGAWIALEDIHEEAGRFFMLKGSQHINFLQENPNIKHSDWLKKIADHVSEHQDTSVTPILNKGDVIFWNSALMHGSTATINEKYSRKSLTGHFLPSHMAFGNLFTQKDFVQYQSYNQYKHYSNQPEYSMMNNIKVKIKQKIYDSPAILKFFRNIQQKFSLARL